MAKNNHCCDSCSERCTKECGVKNNNSCCKKHSKECHKGKCSTTESGSKESGLSENND